MITFGFLLSGQYQQHVVEGEIATAANAIDYLLHRQFRSDRVYESVPGVLTIFRFLPPKREQNASNEILRRQVKVHFYIFVSFKTESVEPANHIVYSRRSCRVYSAIGALRRDHTKKKVDRFVDQ